MQGKRARRADRGSWCDPLPVIPSRWNSKQRGYLVGLQWQGSERECKGHTQVSEGACEQRVIGWGLRCVIINKFIYFLCVLGYLCALGCLNGHKTIGNQPSAAQDRAVALISPFKLSCNLLTQVIINGGSSCEETRPIWVAWGGGEGGDD